ncbi:MAG TPA: saccharopine dehydrogenase NADP-binding domain-containing protein [Rhodocyclaceae bacterium]|nr:saccharopine dehydrogenase NADP-binding domain-containing protein [Rhodocyclaceae bacterium]
MHTILVLGGYGFFGGRICTALAQDKNIHMLIGGRDLHKACAMAASLGLSAESAVAIDAQSSSLAEQLASLAVNTVIHTAGPFQGQNYAVAEAAIKASANYMDLADGRDFVAGIANLDAMAKAKGVLVSSGASSLPSLSSAVVDRYLPRFMHLDSIRHGISSGARAPGLATMLGVFSYCGNPFQRLENGRAATTHGWLDLQAHVFPAPIGKRWLGSCDVPDLDLFVQRYAGVRSVTFHAGFASRLGHLGVWAGAQMVRLGVLHSLKSWVAPLKKISEWTELLVSDKGGMFVDMQGLDHDGNPLHLVWHLLAADHHGPYIPCGASIALARKLANGAALPSGAKPCMGLLSVEDYLAALEGLSVWEVPA